MRYHQTRLLSRQTWFRSFTNLLWSKPDARLWVLASISVVMTAFSPAVAQNPLQPRDGVAYLNLSHLSSNTDRPLVRFQFANTRPKPLLVEQKPTAAHRLLMHLYLTGKAAGNVGDVYDNRDRGHSKLKLSRHPQVTQLLYGSKLKEQNADIGIATYLLFDAPVIGNSSMAVTSGAYARSLPRVVMIGKGQVGMQALHQNFRNNQIHVYPSHHDVQQKSGDLYAANTPYYIVSKGSSGSDRRHLEALVMILAAFRPETKKRLMEDGLLAPTVQMIFRKGQNMVPDRNTYLSGIAHPTAFSHKDLDLHRLVVLANTLTPEQIPPEVRLSVLFETPAQNGLHFAGKGLSERLFDTPSAIARVWRSFKYRREMILSAENTIDPNGRPLTFSWVLLRGDPDKVKIEPLHSTGRTARITMDWQSPQPTPRDISILSSRIDIGVFANNGVADSAPAFLSVALPTHESRTYEKGPDGQMRIKTLLRSAKDGVSFDPFLFPISNWRDDYKYASDGRMLGWTRTTPTSVRDFDSVGKSMGIHPEYNIIEGRRGIPLVVP